jgi:hypothetical protein
LLSHPPHISLSHRALPQVRSRFAGLWPLACTSLAVRVLMFVHMAPSRTPWHDTFNPILLLCSAAGQDNISGFQSFSPRPTNANAELRMWAIPRYWRSFTSAKNSCTGHQKFGPVLHTCLYPPPPKKNKWLISPLVSGSGETCGSGSCWTLVGRPIAVCYSGHQRV